MRVYGRARLQDFLGSFIVYRNLVPLDTLLPGLPELRKPLGIPARLTPRKSSVEYARLMAHILNRAQGVRGKRVPIERLVYIGDTRVNDGTAFINLLARGGWDGAAFIASETPEPEEYYLEDVPSGVIFTSNRWSAIDRFNSYCEERGIPIDERTAVVIDVDKTAIGARGRNDHVIDEVRLQSIQRTLLDSIGESFDEESFKADYARINLPRYHPFTTDNQDYLAYACLILQSGAVTSKKFFHSLDDGELTKFDQFLSMVNDRRENLSSALQRVHDSVHAAFLRGNPTPFLDFRRNEYKVTVEHMGQLKDGTPVEQLLQEEIVITREVMEYALTCRHAGALVFGLSDKPDEASIPSEKIESYLPLHKTETHVVGGG